MENIPFFCFSLCFDFVSFLGDTRGCKGYVAFAPTFGPPKRQGLGGRFGFCPPLFGDLRECRGYVAFPPTYGPILILSSFIWGPCTPPPPLVAIFFAPTFVPQSDECDEAAVSHDICRYRHFPSVYFFSMSFCPCLPTPLGLDQLPPTSPPCPLTA